jgi:alkanesulfonate monooxygenase
MEEQPLDVSFYWRLPTHGDAGTIRSPEMNRGDWTPTTSSSIAPGLRGGQADGFSYVDHLADIARAAEASGFYGGLIPSFPMTDDPWVNSSAIAEQTSSFRFMIAFQPGFLNPVHAIRMSASLQELSGGRLVFNIITGGGGPEQLWWGDPIAHDDRYARTSEFLEVLRGGWDCVPFDHRGRFFDVRGARLPAHLASQPYPEIYYSGSSDAAIESAAAHADFYLSWLEPMDALREKFDRVRDRAASFGREARFAVRTEVLARPTSAEAWRDVREAYESGVRWGNGFTRATESVGAQRQAGFQPATMSSWDDLRAGPALWRGFHLLRGGPPFGIVGDYSTVAEQLDALIEIGVDSFILAATPHLEEAYRVGEEVLPLVRPRRLAAPSVTVS